MYWQLCSKLSHSSCQVRTSVLPFCHSAILPFYHSDLKHFPGPFCVAGGDDGRVHVQKLVLLEEGVRGKRQLVADAGDGGYLETSRRKIKRVTSSESGGGIEKRDPDDRPSRNGVHDCHSL